MIDGTLACSVPGCLYGTQGTSWFLANDVTAFSFYNGVGYALEAYASVQANNCNFVVVGQVSGGYVPNSSYTYYIGIISEATGAVAELAAYFEEVCYADGTLAINGGGSYPC